MKLPPAQPTSKSMKTKGINWASRIANEEKAAVIANLRTKPSERKKYRALERSVGYAVEASTTRASLGNGNSITRNITHPGYNEH